MYSTLILTCFEFEPGCEIPILLLLLPKCANSTCGPPYLAKLSIMLGSCFIQSIYRTKTELAKTNPGMSAATSIRILNGSEIKTIH